VEEEPSLPDEMERLDEYVCCEVFKYLRWKDLASISRVCKLWYYISKDSVLRRNLGIN